MSIFFLYFYAKFYKSIVTPLPLHVYDNLDNKNLHLSTLLHAVALVICYNDVSMLYK